MALISPILGAKHGRKQKRVRYDTSKMSASRALLSTLKDISDLCFNDEAQKLNNFIALSWYLAGI